MKRPITPAYTFNPGAATLNLSGIAGFDVRNLFAVIDLKTGALVYAPIAGYGFAALSGTTLTLQAPMTGLAGADPLMILYDDGAKPAEDASVQAVTAAVGTLASSLASNHGDLATLHTDVGTTLHGDLAAILAKLGTKLSVSIDGDSVTLTLPNGLALDASVQALGAGLATLHGDLQSILTDLASGLTNDTAALAAITATATWQASLLAATQAVTTALHAPLALAPTGQQNAANSLSVVLSSDGPFATNFGAVGDAAATSDTGGFSLMALTKRALGRLTTLLGVLPASLGLKASAASFPVVLASDQGAIPNPARTVVAGALAASGDTVVIAVDGMNTAFAQLLTTAAWSGGPVVFEVSGDGQATWSGTNMVPWSGGQPGSSVAAGAAAVPQLFEMACGGPTHLRLRATGAITGGPIAVILAAASGLKSLRVGSVDGGVATLGAMADAAAAADTGSFSLVALAKRSLARWTTLLGGLPASLGQKAMAAAFPVVIASDQSAVPVSGTVTANQGAAGAAAWPVSWSAQSVGVTALPALPAGSNVIGGVTIGKASTAGDASLAAGGTAQTLFAGATPANGWKVANPDPAEDLWVSDSTTAAPNGQGSYRLPAGGILTTEPGERPCGPVSVYAATTGHLVTARSW